MTSGLCVSIWTILQGKEVEGEPVWYGRKKESRREVKTAVCVTKDGSLGDQDVWMQAKISLPNREITRWESWGLGALGTEALL